MFSMFFSAFSIFESTMPANTCDTDATTPFWATSTPLVCVSNFNRPDTKFEFHIFWSHNEETFFYPGQLLRYDAKAPNCHQIASKFVSSWDLRPSFSSCVPKLGVKLARFSPPSFTTYTNHLEKKHQKQEPVSQSIEAFISTLALIKWAKSEDVCEVPQRLAISTRWWTGGWSSRST